MTDATAPVGVEGDQDRPSRRAERRSSWLKWGILCIVLLVLIVAFRAVRRHARTRQQANASAGEPPAVTVATARRGDFNQYLEALGNVTPVATVNLYSQITGRVVAVHYHEGQLVRRGTPLIDIDPAPYEAQLQQAQGALERDQAALNQAQMDLERYRKATSVSALARQTFEDQQQAVEQYRGTVKYDRGQVEYAKVQLGYCHLVSPIDGRVGLRLVDQGNTVFAGSTTPIVIVTQLQPITVVFDLAEDYLDQVRDATKKSRALPVDAFDRAMRQKITSGKLLTLDNQIDTSTGTVRLRASFENADLRLFPNQFVNARLLVGVLHDVVLIPSDAVQHNGSLAFVYIVTNGTVAQRKVDELGSEGLQTAVSGLNGSESVVTSGFERVQPGAKVTLRPSQTASASDRNGQSAEQGAGAL